MPIPGDDSRDYDFGNTGGVLSNAVLSDIKKVEKLAGCHLERHKDKSDRATVEQVLDPRTRLVLFKWLNQGVISEINGCVSTGKEANVYQAAGPNGKALAIKIYKTSILVFKDRDRYVTGEYRFRHGYSKSNPRKMVKVWAEKEFRNLGRLRAAQIPSPKPILLKSHTLLMSFIGSSDGRAAPRLKNAEFSDPTELKRVYYDLVATVWKLYNRCKLVHADLSEYNLLYYKKKVYTIDVSQSVEHTHPHALEFLRKDCHNVLSFFRKFKAFATLTLKELYDLTMLNTKDLIKGTLCLPGIGASVARELAVKVAAIFGSGLAGKLRDSQADLDCSFEQQDQLLHLYLAYFHDYVIVDRPSDRLPSDQHTEEEIFLKSFIPRNMDEVVNVEREAFSESTGLKLPPSVKTTSLVDSVTEATAQLALDDESDSSLTSGSDSQRPWTEEKPKRLNSRSMKRDESAEDKRQRKQQVKDAKKEKRLTKIPKAVKKRKEKLGKEKKKG